MKKVTLYEALNGRFYSDIEDCYDCDMSFTMSDEDKDKVYDMLYDAVSDVIINFEKAKGIELEEGGDPGDSGFGDALVALALSVSSIIEFQTNHCRKINSVTAIILPNKGEKS